MRENTAVKTYLVDVEAAAGHGIGNGATSAYVVSVSVEDSLRQMPTPVSRYREMGGNLGEAPIDVERAREAIRGLVGEIGIAPREGDLVARMRLEVVQPILLLIVLAGARFGTFRRAVHVS